DRTRHSWPLLRQLPRHLVEVAAEQRLAMIRPAVATPDLEEIEGARDRHFLLQPRELAQLWRDQDSASAVDGALLRTGDHDTDDVPALRRKRRVSAEIFLELLPLIEGKRRHAVIPFAEDERVDAARDKLLAITRGNAEATLRVDGVLIPASK